MALALASALFLVPAPALAQIPITVEGERPGTPVTFGIPFPQGELASTGNVRVLNGSGAEIASQITR